MILEDIASVVAGQIMTRVSADKDTGDEVMESVTVLVPKAICEGAIIKVDLGKVNLSKAIDDDKYTQEGDVIIKLSTPYDAVYISKENVGLAIPSFCAAIRLMDDKVDAKYLLAYLNSSYVRNQLTSKVMGASRPMIKITDIRKLNIPDVSKQNQQDIGEAYMLSAKKRTILLEMIEVERNLMENIVLASMKGEIDND